MGSVQAAILWRLDFRLLTARSSQANAISQLLTYTTSHSSDAVFRVGDRDDRFVAVYVPTKVPGATAGLRLSLPDP